MIIYVDDVGSLDRAISEFKKQVKKEGILDDLKKKEFYVKPSLRRRLKREESRKRRRREENERRTGKTNRSRGNQQDS